MTKTKVKYSFCNENRWRRVNHVFAVEVEASVSTFPVTTKLIFSHFNRICSQKLYPCQGGQHSCSFHKTITLHSLYIWICNLVSKSIIHPMYSPENEMTNFMAFGIWQCPLIVITLTKWPLNQQYYTSSDKKNCLFSLIRITTHCHLNILFGGSQAVLPSNMDWCKVQISKKSDPFLAQDLILTLGVLIVFLPYCITLITVLPTSEKEDQGWKPT